MTHGYEIEGDILPNYTLTHEFDRITINLARVEEGIDLSGILAFINDVSIDRNEIINMSFSGIGTPHKLLMQLLSSPDTLKNRPLLSLLAKHLGVLSGLIVDLSIRENRVFRCFQNSSDMAMRLVTELRGEGGISLGMCENLSICENTIKDNGRDHRHTACGIFVSYAAQANISGNKILNNGPLNPKAGADLLPGIRGGIVLRMAIPLLITGALDDITAPAPRELLERSVHPAVTAAIGMASAMAGSAARIHDNLIKQSVGQALRIFALGPVSVLNNQFTVDFSNNPQIQPRGQKWMDRHAGAVLVLNFGRQTKSHEFKIGDLPARRTFPNFPGGNVLYAQNQTRLGVDLFSLASQVIVTWDDLSFDNNQSEVLSEISPVLWVNTALAATTLRATSNRLEEPTYEIQWGIDTQLELERLSMFTFGVSLNNTMNNQGDHCIVARSWQDEEKLVDAGNRAVWRELTECAGQRQEVEDSSIDFGSDLRLIGY
jgi:hypothetical protein